MTEGINVSGSIGDAAAIDCFLAGVARLPASVQIAVHREAAMLAPGFIKPADDGELAAFRLLPNGAAMIAAWNTRARRCVAIFAERFNRVQNAVGDQDRPALHQWWDGLPPRDKVAVIWAFGSAE